MQPFQARRIAFNLGVSGEAFKQMVKFITSLYRAYEAIDASLFEINPVLDVKNQSGEKVATGEALVEFPRDLFCQ